ncbi:MAG: hypothetical protein N3E52_00405 [Candidatus Bathyarchaeota archaeon]|nr:hypothetical protein [Candidatus Bathyarchaeota archaeon]
MTLDHFLRSKEIIIDAAGWGDLLLGVVIGALKPPDRRYMERRIPTASFQPPNFKNKKYLKDSVKIADEIIEVMRPDEETHFKVSTAYVLLSVREHLQDLGFKVEKTEFTGELRNMVERGYLRWCNEVGVPEEVVNSKRRFWAMLKWVAEKPRLREKLVKTGWASWEQKWRKEIFKPIDVPS